MRSHLLHERSDTTSVARVEAVSLINEEHLAYGLVHYLLGFLGCLADEALTQATTKNKQRNGDAGER